MIRHGNENCVIAFRGGGDRMDLEFVEFCGIGERKLFDASNKSVRREENFPRNGVFINSFNLLE